MPGMAVLFTVCHAPHRQPWLPRPKMERQAATFECKAYILLGSQETSI
jgi:hypothetical protein